MISDPGPVLGLLENHSDIPETELPEYPKLISASAYEKCAADAARYQDRIVYGGRGDASLRKFEPTVLYPVSREEEIVQRELFSPLLPVVPFKDHQVDELLSLIASREHGLALYLFTRSKKVKDKVFATCSFGGGCVNDTIIHLATHHMGFGGVGNSGMGSYHGKRSFDTFSHYRAIVDKATWLDLPMRYMPYKPLYDKMIRMFLK